MFIVNKTTKSGPVPTICSSMIKFICALAILTISPANALEVIALAPTIITPEVVPAVDDAQRDWLKKKKTLVLGISQEIFEPYEILQGRSLKGIVADHIYLIANSLSLEPHVFMYPDWKSAVQALKRGEVDVLSKGGIQDDPTSELTHSTPYVVNSPIVVGRGTELGFSKIQIQGDIAVSGNFVDTEAISKNFENSSTISFDSVLEALHSVEYQRQRWYIGDPIEVGYYKGQGELQYIHTYRSKFLEKNGYSFLFRKDNERLRALFDEVLNNTPPSQKNKILNYWSANIDIEAPAEISFNLEEQQWLSGHPDVAVAINSSLPPYSFYDDSGEIKGVIIDLLAEISQELGINFRIIDTSSLDELEQTLRNKSADMTLTLLPNEERANYLRFTEPYLFNSFALITRKDSKISSIADLKGKKVAIQRGNFVAARVAQLQPTISVIKKASQLDSLVAVANGEADAAITLLPTATYLIRQYFSHDLKVSTSLPDLPANLPFSIRPEQVELYSVMTKVIEKLGPNHINTLMSNWKAVAPAQTSVWKEYIASFRLLSIGAILSSLLLLSLIVYLFVKRRHMQHEAERFEFRSTLLDSIPMAISVRDLEGRFVFCNQVFYSQLKTQAEHVIGKRTFEFIGVERDQANEHQRFYFQTLKNGIPAQRQFDATINGAHLTFRQWDRPYTGKNGNIAGLISGYADMTSNVLLLQQLRESHDRAVQANDAKSRFLAVMSHEIRTPLNAIIGLLELTIQRIEQGDPWDRNDLEVAYGSSKSLIELIDDILDLAKIESGNLNLMIQRSNLSEITHSVIRIFSGVARQKGLYLRLEENLQSTQDVSLDAGRLKQVLSNILSNAIKFTDTGGVEIKVSTFSSPEGAHIGIEISDSGIGISLEDQEKLFTPFTQATTVSHSRGGTGLGLAICRQLVHMMGGSLELHSSMGKGTQIRILLIAPELEDAPPQSTTLTDKRPLKQLHILLVDDHPANRLLLGQQLQFLGHTVREAEDGLQALDLLFQQPFDLVITDCHMPVMDGYELSRRWRTHEAKNNLKPCWIMGFTANAQPQERAHCLDAGMDGCLFKPVSLAELTACLEDLAPRSDHSHEPAVQITEHSSLIDHASIAGITNGNEKLAAMLITQLHTSNGLDLQQLKERVIESQWKEIALLAHRIKGVARLINSKALIDAAQAYETALENGASDDHKRSLAVAICQTLERLQVALSDHLSSINIQPTIN
jgi:two-component system sensor histidine kinase EvgS